MLYIVGSDQKESERTGSGFSLMLHINGSEGSYRPRDHIPSFNYATHAWALSVSRFLSPRGLPVSTEPSHFPVKATVHAYTWLTRLILDGDFQQWVLLTLKLWNIFPNSWSRNMLLFIKIKNKNLCWQSLQIHKCFKNLTKPKFTELPLNQKCGNLKKTANMTTHPIMSRDVWVQKAGQFPIDLNVY